MSGESTTTFDDLPIHLQLLVLSFVETDKLNQNVSTVSTHWRNLCNDPWLWRRLEIDGWLKYPNEIVTVFNRNFFVVDVVFNRIINFSWINSIEKHSKLTQIKFERCKLHKNVLTRFAQTFPNVNKISFIHCENVNIELIAELVGWKNSLKSVEINEDEDVSACVPIIAKKIKSLEELEISDCKPIKEHDLKCLINLQGTNLKCLSLRICGILDKDLALLTQKCVNLTHLTLRQTCEISNNGLLMLQKLESLEYFHVGDSINLFSNNFSVLFEKAKFGNLREVVIHRHLKFDDLALKTLVKSSPNLTDLTLHSVPAISHEGLRCLPDVCSNLELLILIDALRITKNCLREIVTQLPKMRYCFLKNPYINLGKPCLIVDKRTKRLFHKKYRLFM